MQIRLFVQRIVFCYRLLSEQGVFIRQNRRRRNDIERCGTNGGKMLVGYYEHIIRNAESYGNIAEYIITNPTRWQDDNLYIDNFKQ